MGYHHHHQLSITITLIALFALLFTVGMGIYTSILSVGLFIMYWIFSSLYFQYAGSKVEEKMLLTFMGNFFLFILVSFIAFLSQADLLNIVLGILMSVAILMFPLSHSLTPSRDLRRLVRLPQVKHKYYIPFSSCYRVDLDFPDPLYIRDVAGSKEMELSFYLKNPARHTEIRKPSIIKEMNQREDRVSIEIDKKIIRRYPSRVFEVVQNIARKLSA